ncbi:MAG TPA: glucans biosynthesis glucosyltransferase MdoH [Rhodopila sp.]|uniref:glucans biosynthesis glucosyltransferase MdoH n=1 Tax=Rhodopila sp. TaxID=2480087 RepID=UPI002CABE839|nr:glucans biosynthesis glucosyltransferase MdoH [Rhodopila sp.]HVY18039.1 glucans biosynthesis glucosyltransferase MdoH [Rhodopila sp.]
MDVDLTVRPLPPESPLAMPVQSLRRPPSERRRIEDRPRLLWLRRFLVIGAAIVLTGFGAREMYRVLGVNGLTAPGAFMLVLFVALFAWIALSFTSAIAGFVSIVTGGGAYLRAKGRPTTRTALLMPTYNESPDRIVAALQAMDEDLREAGASGLFDIFILSDTTRPEVWIREERAWLGLCARTGGAGRIFYRHRPKNTARKAGNIAEWVTRFGGAYPQFLILDADSVMRADTLLTLVRAMETHPDTGLIQTLPVITGGTTLFARMQQFAGRIYGPVIAHGIAWWHGTEGNYWGHNALIRSVAFAEQAGLPELKGNKPFGGHILSHDFVEAALIRRGGWAVHMMPALEGSYEESPPSLIDLAIRDRRWCQGNLQHAAVLPSRGLHWISRLHLLTGIGSYITAPLWLLFLLSGIVIALQARFIPPDYFGSGKSLFPLWPVIDPVRAMWVFIGTMAMLLVPKVLGILAALFQSRVRRGSGGVLGLLVSLVFESVIAGLLAPVVMLTQSIDVAAILLGRDSGWNAQRRDDGGIPFREIVRTYRRHTLLGVVLGVGAWAVSTSLALWMLPVILGLVLAVPLAAWTGRRDAGQALRRLGLLRIPEESRPPDVLKRTLALQAAAAETGDDVAMLLRDPDLMAAHRTMLPPPRRPGVDPLNVPLLTGSARLAEARDFASVWPTLDVAERMAVLSDGAALERLQAIL